MVKSGQASRGLLALLAAWAVGLPALLPRRRRARSSARPWVHFWLVATGALVAAAASVGLTVAGARASDGRTVLLGAAFSTMTALLAIHAIATPGILVGAERRDRPRRRRRRCPPARPCSRSARCPRCAGR